MMNTTRKPENKFRHRLKELGLGGLPPVPPIPDLSMYKKDKYENSVLLHHKPSYRLQQQRSSRIQTTHSSL